MFRSPYLCLFIAALLRVVYWLQVNDEAWFIAPGTDPEFYMNWTDAILTGHGADYIPFPRAPLYPYLLAVLQGLFGQWWLLPRLLNLLADVTATLMIFHIIARIRDRKTGFIAGMLYALSGASIYFSGEILMTSLATALTAGFLLSLISCYQNPNLKWSAVAGLAVGITALLRPNILLLLPFSLYIIGLGSYRRFITAHCCQVSLPDNIDKGIETTVRYGDLTADKPIPCARIFTTTSIHLLTVILVLLPIVLANWQASKQLIPISTQGGVNFYIGNARSASGWASSLPGAGASWSDHDAQQIASKHAGKELSQLESSRELLRMGWNEIISDPVSWIRLMTKKMLLLINVREIANNRPFSLAANVSFHLQVLILLSFGLLIPFTLVGIGRCFNSINVRIIIGFAVLYSFSILIFFVNTRYRMPVLPAVVMLAALGIIEFCKGIKDKKRTWSNVSLLLLGGLLAFPNWFGDHFEQPAQIHFIAGNAFLRLGQADKALEQYKQAEQIDPDFTELQLNIGVSLLSIGDTTAAESAFEKELTLRPNNAKAHNNLGVILEGQGRLQNAIEEYSTSLRLDPTHSDARINLWRAHMKRGDILLHREELDSAVIEYQFAAGLRKREARSLYKLALISIAQERWADTHRLLKEALLRDPSYQPARTLINRITSQEKPRR